MELENDDVLLDKLATNDWSSMNLIFKQYYKTVYYSAMRILSDMSIADDISQEVFIDLWSKRTEIKVQTNLEAYLRKMAVNKSLNYIRDNKKISFSVELDDHQSSNEPDYIQNENFREIKELLYNAIDKLPPQCKIIFVLSRFEDYSNKMIAKHLDISIKTVENQMTKALKILRNVSENFYR